MAIQQEFGSEPLAARLARWLAAPGVTNEPDYCTAAVPESNLGASQPEPGSLIMPGSFNPLHAGHMAMVDIAVARFSAPCWFEISVNNVEKQRLCPGELQSRLRQNFRSHGVIVTNTPTFVQKSKLFPESVFIVGADTIVRFADPNYHGGDRDQLNSAIETMTANKCHFLVFGRMISNKFVDQQNIVMEEELLRLCTFVNREQFSMHVSSTAIRQQHDRNPSEEADG